MFKCDFPLIYAAGNPTPAEGRANFPLRLVLGRFKSQVPYNISAASQMRHIQRNRAGSQGRRANVDADDIVARLRNKGGADALADANFKPSSATGEHLGDRLVTRQHEQEVPKSLSSAWLPRDPSTKRGCVSYTACTCAQISALRDPALSHA